MKRKVRDKGWCFKWTNPGKRPDCLCPSTFGDTMYVAWASATEETGYSKEKLKQEGGKVVRVEVREI